MTKDKCTGEDTTEDMEKYSYYCCRKGDPFQGPKMGSCLTPEMNCLRRNMC